MQSYKVGSLYALIAASLYATQDPFSFLAAKRLDTIQFILLTQVALLISLPLLLSRAQSRRDIVALLSTGSNYGKLGLILAVEGTGLVLYNLGLGHSHPVIISAILSLAPFWAAVAALLVTKVPFPVSPLVFFGCLTGAFLGALAIAWSQTDASGAGTDALASALRKGSWVYAVPVPICTTLGATLICKWFSKFDESAAIAANFLFANVVIIPATIVILYLRSELVFGQIEAIALMIVGTITAAAFGRVLYQIALSATGADNGFVSMFLNLVPALSALISYALSWWIPELVFHANWLYFLGLLSIGASLLNFSTKSWRSAANGRDRDTPTNDAAFTNLG